MFPDDGVSTTQVTLVDAETGEVLVTTSYRPGDAQDMRDYKGWLLRWRTIHKRRTGHGIVVTGHGIVVRGDGGSAPS